MAYQSAASDSLDGIDCPLYDPFRRKDRFGLIGSAPMKFQDRLLATVFSLTVLPVRVMMALMLLVGCYLTCLMTQLLPANLQPSVMAPIGRLYCRVCLAVIGVQIQWIDRSNSSTTDAFPCAIVSNHVSWLDILVHMAESFPAFVAAASVRNLPFVGKISEMMGCIYVERENRSAGYQGVSGKVQNRMQQTAASRSTYGRILLFPEGTTTNGDFLLKFKRGAFCAGLPVQPVVLIYSSHWISPAWESITGSRHVRLLLSFPYATVQFVKLPVYSPSEEEKHNPELFAENVRSFMVTASKQPFQRSDATIVQKRQYQALLRKLFKMDGEKVD